MEFIMRIGLALSLSIFPEHQTPTASSPQAAPPTTQGRANLEARLNELHRQIQREFGDSTRAVVERADRATKGAQTLLDVVKLWVPVVSLLFLVLLTIGWREFGLIQKAGESVKQARGETDKALEQIRSIGASIRHTIEEAEQRFSTLPRLERQGIVGELSRLPPPEDVLKLEEADMAVTMADKINAVEPSKLVDPLVQLGRFWRVTGNYTKAIARFRKAMDIDPKSVDAPQGLYRTLYTYAVIRDGIGKSYKEQLLHEAETGCLGLVELHPTNALLYYDLGWVYDELGNYDEAIRYYTLAQERDLNSEWPNITYNLACTYSKTGKYREALNELSKVIDKDSNWEDAARDEELDGLKKDKKFGPRFAGLIAEAGAKKGKP